MGFIDTISPPAGVWTALNQIPGPCSNRPPLIESEHDNLTPLKRPCVPRSNGRRVLNLSSEGRRVQAQRAQAIIVRAKITPAGLSRTQVLAEERHYEVLEPDGDRAGVRARIDLESIRNAVAIENVMQFLGVDAQSVLVAHVDGDSFVLFQVA